MKEDKQRSGSLPSVVRAFRDLCMLVASVFFIAVGCGSPTPIWVIYAALFGAFGMVAILDLVIIWRELRA